MSSSTVGGTSSVAAQSSNLQTQGINAASKASSQSSGQSSEIDDISSLFSRLIQQTQSASAAPDDSKQSDNNSSASSLLEALKRHHHQQAGQNLLQTIEQALNADPAAQSGSATPAAASVGTASS